MTVGSIDSGSTVRSFAPGTGLVDLHFQGHAEYIACYLLEAGSELLLVDPGPASTLAALEQGLRLAGHPLAAVTGVLLTHIHLDHAGGVGVLVRRHPHLRVYVHRYGAPHLVDPARLLASARRLYGDRMDALWGAVLPVPETALRALDGSERLRLGSRCLEVAYTPGHARHHVSYYDPDTGVAFVGDTAGIRIDNRPFVLPVTPPPDIDLRAWRETIRRLRTWAPRLLCPTHFGPAMPVPEHLREFERRLRAWADIVRRDLAAGTDDATAAAALRRRVAGELVAAVGAEDAERYLRGGGVDASWHGLARYFRRHPQANIEETGEPTP